MSEFEELKKQLRQKREERERQKDLAEQQAREYQEEEKRRLQTQRAETIEINRKINDVIRPATLSILNGINQEVFENRGQIIGWQRKTVSHTHTHTTSHSEFGISFDSKETRECVTEMEVVTLHVNGAGTIAIFVPLRHIEGITKPRLNNEVIEQGYIKVWSSNQKPGNPNTLQLPCNCCYSELINIDSRTQKSDEQILQQLRSAIEKQILNSF